MNCPKCQSSEWKLASVVHSQGVSSIETSTTGETIGVAAGPGGLAAGYARSNGETSGKQITAFAESCAPPDVQSHPGNKITFDQKNTAVAAAQLFAVTVGLFLIFRESVLFGFVALSIVFVYRARLRSSAAKDRKAEYEAYETEYAKTLADDLLSLAKYAKWERTMVCQRCGTHFQPDDA